MKSYTKLSVLLLVLSISLGGCATYHLSTQSLVEQCANTHPQEKLTMVIAFPLFLPFEVTGNDLTEIKVLDKNEQEQILPVNHHTSIRIIKKDSRKKSFYFNTLIVKDSTITGKIDHFIGMNITPINLNDIEKIEIQK